MYSPRVADPADNSPAPPSSKSGGEDPAHRLIPAVATAAAAMVDRLMNFLRFIFNAS